MKTKNIATIVVSLIVVIALVVGGISLYVKSNNLDGDSARDNSVAVTDDRNRSITITNKTGQIINEVRFFVDDVIEVEKTYQKNCDEDSFNVMIPRKYKNYDRFTIKIVDRYDLLYVKEITNVAEKGVTYVDITEDDYVEQKGDFKKKLDKFFNGD